MIVQRALLKCYTILYSTETVLLIFPFLQTKVTVHECRGARGTITHPRRVVVFPQVAVVVLDAVAVLNHLHELHLLHNVPPLLNSPTATHTAIQFMLLTDFIRQTTP